MELALLHEGHEPLQGDDAEDEGDDHAYQKFRGKARSIGAGQGLFRLFDGVASNGFGVLALDPLDAIQEGGATDSGNAHEEAEFAGVLAVHAQKDHAADGRAAAADARDASDALHNARHQSAPPVHLDALAFRMLAAGLAPLGNKQQRGGKQHGAAHGLGIFEQAFKRLLEADADDGSRNGSQHDVARFLQLNRIAADAAHNHVHKFLAEHDEDGKESSRVEHDVEEHARFLHVQELFAKNKMAGTGNGEKFCKALQQAQNDRFKHGWKYRKACSQ